MMSRKELQKIMPLLNKERSYVEEEEDDIENVKDYDGDSSGGEESEDQQQMDDKRQQQLFQQQMEQLEQDDQMMKMLEEQEQHLDIQDESAVELLETRVHRGIPGKLKKIYTKEGSEHYHLGDYNYRLIENCVYLMVDPGSVREWNRYLGPIVKLGAFNDGNTDREVLKKYIGKGQWADDLLNKMRPDDSSNGGGFPIDQAESNPLESSPVGAVGWTALPAHGFFSVPNFEKLVELVPTVDKEIPKLYQRHLKNNKGGAFSMYVFETQVGPMGGRSQKVPRHLWIWYEKGSQKLIDFKVGLKMADEHQPMIPTNRISGSITLTAKGWMKFKMYCQHVLREGKQMIANLPATTGMKNYRAFLVHYCNQILDDMGCLQKVADSDFQDWHQTAWKCLKENTSPTKALIASFSDVAITHEVGPLSVQSIRDHLYKIYSVPESKDHEDFMMEIYNDAPCYSPMEQQGEKEKKKRDREGETSLPTKDSSHQRDSEGKKKKKMRK